jgi:hypothetical protein
LDEVSHPNPMLGELLPVRTQVGCRLPPAHHVMHGHKLLMLSDERVSFA